MRVLLKIFIIRISEKSPADTSPVNAYVFASQAHIKNDGSWPSDLGTPAALNNLTCSQNRRDWMLRRRLAMPFFRFRQSEEIKVGRRDCFLRAGLVRKGTQVKGEEVAACAMPK